MVTADIVKPISTNLLGKANKMQRKVLHWWGPWTPIQSFLSEWLSKHQQIRVADEEENSMVLALISNLSLFVIPSLLSSSCLIQVCVEHGQNVNLLSVWQRDAGFVKKSIFAGLLTALCICEHIHMHHATHAHVKVKQSVIQVVSDYKIQTKQELRTMVVDP